jgi:hypothetical protein
MSMESYGGMILTGELREKPVPVPHCTPQIPHGLTQTSMTATNHLSHGTAKKYVTFFSNLQDDKLT